MIFTLIFYKDFLQISERGTSETSIIVSQKYSRVDFHPDYYKDFKILTENLKKIQAENILRIFFLCFSRKLLQKF